MPKSSTIADVALLTDRRYTASKADNDNWYFQNILKDDNYLQQALLKKGITTKRVDWADPKIDWSLFKCVVFRSTWDYFDRIDEFKTWLKKIEDQTIVCNHPDLIWWNMDKHYLQDLKDSGIPIVPSVFLDKGDLFEPEIILSTNGWKEGVIKPCISGGARHTYRVNLENADEIQSIIQPLLKQEDFLFQPFLDQIIDTGEDTLIMFNGEVTHAVRKIAKPGDFRVQDDHGGTVHHLEPTTDQITLAKNAFSACAPIPAYGRVDMVQNNLGQWLIMEMELIEPELWIRFHPESAEPFADAIADLIE